MSKNRLPLLAQMARKKPIVAQPLNVIYNATNEISEYRDAENDAAVWSTNTRLTEQTADPTGDERSDR